MEENNHESNHRSLIITLVSLCVIAIILVVTILLINIDNRQKIAQAELEHAEASLPEELKGDDLSPADKVIKETSIMFADPNYSNDDILSYYDDAIAKALEASETFLAAKIAIQKMNFIAVSLGNCDTAMTYVGGLDLSPFPAEDVSYLASYVISTAETCANQDAVELWTKIYTDNGGK